MAFITGFNFSRYIYIFTSLFMSHIFARHIHLNSWFYFVGRCENSLARNFVSTSDTEIFEHFHTGVQYALCHFLLSHTHTHTSCECHFHFYLHLNHLIFMHCAHSWACFFPRCLFIFDTIRKLKKNKPRNKIIKEKKKHPKQFVLTDNLKQKKTT